MKQQHYISAIILGFCLCGMPTFAQDDDETQKVSLTGSLQTDGLFPQVDDAIGTGTYDANYLSNTYLDLGLRSKYVSAGARLELLNKPLPGFEDGFSGAGIQNLYVTGQNKWGSFTVGDFYDQFGSGLIFRTYEERSLGIDNSLRGARITLQPYKGISIKALGGKQRVYFNYGNENAFGFDYSQGAVMGADMELNIEEWVPQMQENNWRLLAGASFVSRYQPEEDIFVTPALKLNLPEYVGAADFRIRMQKGNWNVLAEYAYKANDPSADNNYIYKPGSALLLSGAYSKRGMSVLLQVKRSDNMSFRTNRTQRGTAAFINHLPAFSNTHTYALAALYPYATQPDGEWAFQGELRYTFKRKTAMGGKYGTTFKLNASHIRGLDQQTVDGGGMGTDGYNAPFFGMGDETYYTDVNLELNKKLSKQWMLNALYMYQEYNQKVVEGHGHNGDLVRSNILVVDAKYQPTQKVSMRAELQYLYTRQDKGQWVYGLYEIALFNSLMISVSDMYNMGETNLHYYMGTLTYSIGSHRIQAGYGRTRAGYNCSGGVCRYVPASKGFQVSYNVNF